MSMTAVSKLFPNLDMVSIYNKKQKKMTLKSIIVFVNSTLFLNVDNFVLQVKNVKYETDGMIKQAWGFIAKEKYKLAEELFDKILLVSDKSHRTFFGKFVVCLLQDKDAYLYLKRTIETKNDSSLDDYYRLYLTLFNEFMEIDEDYIPLLELLKEPKKIVAFNKVSYNGRYLEFLDKVSSGEYELAKKALSGCIEMKQSIYLNVLNVLLNKVISHQCELKIKSEKLEKELEKKRILTFVQAVKNKDLINAKKALEIILNFRNQENKDNYIYYLFLELIETIELVENNITFEIMPVNYNYAEENDNLYTFYEAIAAGDFAKALDSGKKCRGKLLDSKQPYIKVNLYVILLELLYEKIEERNANINNLFEIIISNIDKGNYKHALNLYNDNSLALKDYNSRLINCLLENFMAKNIYENVNYLDNIDKSNKEIEDTILSEPIVEASDELFEVNQNLEDETVSVQEDIFEETVNNNMQIFLRHNEPSNEFFHKYQICLVNKKFNDAKQWLDLFAEVLNQNNINKRLDYYYYQINLGMLESSYPDEVVYQRKQVYFLAYNCMLEASYEDALIYLNYYIDTDQFNDNRGYLLLGRLYTLMKNPEAAIDTYIKANAIAPSPDAYYFLGDLYYQRHNWADAVFCYLTYNEFYPKENITVYLNLAECYRHLGKTGKVVKYLKMAEDINIEQDLGMYLKDRILKAEMLEQKKNARVILNKENQSNIVNDND